MQNTISVRGAREHHLKNINVDIPKNQLVVITGLSGSGKSSLAFDTLYAEGQRRYVESLSAYARQFLQLMQKPDMDSIDGLSPAISIEQKTTSKNPRSTVGTITEIYDYLRLLFARVGIPYSPTTGLPIEAQTISQMVDRILKLPVKTKIMILAPMVRNRKGEFKKEFIELKKQGFQRVQVDGETYDLDDVPALKKNNPHNINIIVDRIIISENQEELSIRIAQSLETALKLTDGLAWMENLDDKSTTVFSAKFSCPESGFTIEEIEPRLFSFNSPQGACPACDGLGQEPVFDVSLIVPKPELSIRAGAIAPWAEDGLKSWRGKMSQHYYAQTLDGIAHYYKVSTEESFENLPKRVQDIFLYGSGDEVIPIVYQQSKRDMITKKAFEGVIPNLRRRWHETDNDWTRDFLKRFQREAPCSVCQGHRLKKEALSVKINKLHIGDITNFSIKQALKWFEEIDLTEKQHAIAERVLKEVISRLKFLVDVGLDYLTIARSATTLSGGENQRIRLASQVGSGLTGVLYVLDEPSIGLHQRDNARLLKTLEHLRDLGNSVIVVEHDEDAIMIADHVIDMGPLAGVHGGEIVAEGKPQDIIDCKKSITGDYLAGRRFIAQPTHRRSALNNSYIELKGASSNNLKNVDVKIPLGVLTCVTGVSGSGKSTLIIETLYKALSKELMRSVTVQPGTYKKIEGLELLDKVIDIDQSPIGRTPRSNPATYVGCFTSIREWFAGLPEAKSRGYSAGRFSFNVKGGRCEACQGDGLIKIEMHFLPDVYVECDQCKGKRYNRETLGITYRDKNIADILAMTIDEAVDFFQNIPSIKTKMITLQQVGLGYISVGQQATTLSGGEAQRVKLAKELSKRATGRTIYILDEPTTGLHFEDIRKLLEVIQTLVDQGNTVLVIEHNLDVIKTADYVIDMGPEGGDGGGRLLYQGTPEGLLACKESHTAEYLGKLLEVERERKAV